VGSREQYLSYNHDNQVGFLAIWLGVICVRDHVRERERMQLKGPSVFLVGAAHTLLYKAGDEYSMHNANAYPAYQYPNPNRSKCGLRIWWQGLNLINILVIN
jgi:hypothetical protein